MAGPWEKYQQPAEDGPWTKYKTAEKPDDPRDSVLGKVDAAMRGAADTLSFGLADEAAAHLRSGPMSVPEKPDAYYDQGIYAGQYNPLGMIARSLDAPFASDTKAADYDRALAEERAIDKTDAQDRGGYRLAGQLAGGVTGGVGLAKNGLSMAANAAERGASLGRVAAASAGEGAILGGAQGFGSGEGLADRAKSSMLGGLIGAGTGGIAPYAIAGAQKIGGMAAAPVMARLLPENYSQRAIGDAVRRSGMSVDDITQSLARAQADDQAMFTVADAMGNSGQRMLSTVARNPSDARQGVVEALQNRQVGQGERLASYLAEGFGAPDTAAQRAARLTAQRSAQANANYGAARASAGVVDPTDAIRAADDFLTPGATAVMSPGNAIADDSIEAAVRRARSYLTDGNSVLTDFNASMRAKQELDAMIDGARPAVQRQLIPIRNALDDALEQASPDYAQARNVFRQQSKAIEAVDAGRAAASPRMRAGDTVPAFGRMAPDEQSAFRAGYADPYIARIESASMSPTTNKARALITPKTGEEFPAFALPGRADQMGNRIAREQRMFETANAALGGSKTADNLADAAEMAKFDPGIMSKLVRADLLGALMEGATKIAGEAGGTPPRVVEQIAKALMETDPSAAQQALTAGMDRLSRSDYYRAQILAALLGSGSAGSGRLAP